MLRRVSSRLPPTRVRAAHHRIAFGLYNISRRPVAGTDRRPPVFFPVDVRACARMQNGASRTRDDRPAPAAVAAPWRESLKTCIPDGERSGGSLAGERAGVIDGHAPP